MGSMSPIRSAMVTSGVASFSSKRRSRPSQSMGASSPASASILFARALTGRSGSAFI
jgi:hypothetical protein